MDARANFGYSTVAAAPSPALTGTALDVVSASAYPAVPFNASVWPADELPLNSNAEIVRVTAIVGATLTIVRAQEGTTAKAIAIGYQFAATVTAKTITDIETEKAGVNGAITGGSITVNSSGVSVSLPAYLTTAGLSGDTTKYAGVGETVGTVAGTDLGLTVNTAGVSIAHPNWLTTAQAPGAYLTTAALSGDTTKYAGIGETVGTVAGTDLAMTVNTDGVSVAYPKWLTTAQAPGAYLTTARASNDAVGLATALTDNGVAWTVNSAGISLNVPAFLTTAGLSGDTTKYAGVGETVTTTGGTDLAMTVNTAGVNIAHPVWLTTAMASNRGSDFAGVGETVTTTAGTDLVMTVNTAGVNIAHPVWLTTAQAPGAYLTTAALSNHSHGNPTLNLTNLSGTTASASNGFTLSLSAAAPGGAGSPKSYGIFPDQMVANSSAVQASGSSSMVMPVMIPYDMSISYLRLPVTLSAIGSMASVATAANATRGMTVSSTINVVFYTLGAGANSRSLQSVASGSASWVQQARVSAGAVGSNWTTGHTISFPREGGNTDFTLSAAATVTNVTMQSSQLSDFTNLRFLDIPFATSLSAGAYWMAYGSSTTISTSGTANYSTLRILASNMAVTQPNQAIHLMGSATNSSNALLVGLGSWSTNAIGTTGSIGLANISSVANHPALWFQLIRQA